MNAERIAVAGAVLAAIGAVAWMVHKLPDDPEEAGHMIGGAPIKLATGVVYGIGDAVGLPRTNETECEKALREGRKWDASFACPAGTFLKHVFD